MGATEKLANAWKTLRDSHLWGRWATLWPSPSCLWSTSTRGCGCRQRQCAHSWCSSTESHSVCCHTGVPTPQTKDLNSVTVAKADASPTANSGRYGWRTQPKSRQKLRWSQHRSGSQGAGKDCSKPPSSSSLPPLARQVPSLPLLSPSSVMRSGAFLRVEIQKWGKSNWQITKRIPLFKLLRKL